MNDDDKRLQLIYKLNLIKKLKTMLMGLGFDYSLIGTHYLQDIIIEILLTPTKIHGLSSKVMNELVNNENATVKCIDKDIRWSIKKAYSVGILKKITFFNGNVPTIKQFVNWIFDFFNIT